MHITDIIDALKETPWWVYLLLAYLISRGVLALKTRTISIYKIFILPTVFFIWGLSSLVGKLHNTQFIILWVSGLFLGCVIGWLMYCRSRIQIDKEHGLVTFPGSSLTLILVLTIFAVKYFFGYIQETNALTEYSCLLTAINALTSGIITGIFMGIVASVLYKYNRTL